MPPHVPQCYYICHIKILLNRIYILFAFNFGMCLQIPLCFAN
jgi:hypothetical protein